MNNNQESASKKLLNDFKTFAKEINLSSSHIANYHKDWEMLVDKTGNVLKVSPSCKFITGYSTEDFLRSPDIFQKLIYRPNEFVKKQLFSEIDPSMVENFLEFRIKTKSGRVKWIEMLRNVVFDEEQKPNGYFIHCRDNSDTKLKELEIKKLNKKLKEERNLFLKGKVVIFKLKNAPGWPLDHVTENVSQLGFDQMNIKLSYKNFKTILHPADQKVFEEWIRNIENSHSDTVEIENIRIVNQKDDVLHLKLNVRPVFRNNRLKQIIVYAEDISSEVKLRDKAENSERMFSTAFKVCPDIHAIVDLQSRVFVDINPAFSKKLGYGPDEIVGKTVNELLKLESSSRERIEKEFLANGRVENAETTFLTKDGHSLKVLLYADLVKNKNKQLIYVTAVDITETSRNKEKIKELSLLAENSVDAAIMTDNDGVIRWVNRSFEQTRKYEKNEVIGKHYWELFDNKTLRKEIKMIIEHGQSFKNELLTTSKEGDAYWVLVEIVPDVHPDKKKSKRLILETEITELKNVEKRLFRHIEMQSTLISIALNYINVPIEKIGDTTTQAMKDIAGFVSADRAYIYYYDFEKNLALNKYKWSNCKLTDENQILEQVDLDELNDFLAYHRRGETFYIKNIQAYKAGKTKDILSIMGIQSLLAIPFMMDNKCTGFLGLDYLNRPGRLTQNEQSILVLFTEILSSIFQRYEMELRLRSVNERFETVVENAPLFISAFDKDYNCLMLNKYTEKVFGYSRDEINKFNSIMEVFFPDPGERSKTITELRGQPFNKFHQINPRTKSGERINVMHATYLLPDGTLINIGYDNTERVQYEKNLIESEKRFKEIIENAKSIHFRQRYDSLDFDYVSPSVEDVLGYSVDEIKTIKFERGATNKLFHPDSDEENKRLPGEFDKLDNEHLIKEMKMVHKNGQPKYMRIDYSVSKNENNEPAYIIGVVEDITEEKQTHIKLKESEEKYRGLVERLDEMIFRFNLESGYYDYMSDSVASVFGYEKKVFDKQPNYVRKILHPDNAGYFDDRIKDLINGHVEPVYEYKIIDAKGKTRWILQSNKGVFNEKGKIIALEGMCKDVTANKESERRLYLQIKEIEDYKNKLKRLNKQIVDSEERERKRIASYLHDGIGQLLAIANMELSCLFDEKLSFESKSSLEESARLLKEAISQTRSLTYELDPPMLYESGLIPTIKWRAKQIEQMTGINVNINDSLCYLPIDKNTRVLLYRSINELLNNALKHSNAQKVDVTFEQKDKYCLITVRDNGIGFSYHKVMATNIKNGKFGLFSLSERLEAIHANLLIQSKKGSGTKATIKIAL